MTGKGQTQKILLSDSALASETESMSSSIVENTSCEVVDNGGLINPDDTANDADVSCLDTTVAVDTKYIHIFLF